MILTLTTFQKRQTMQTIKASQVVLVVKNQPANAGDLRHAGLIPGSGRSAGGGHATHSSILAWRVPKTGTELVIAHRITKRHYRSDLACMHGDSEKIVFLGLGERGGE